MEKVWKEMSASLSNLKEILMKKHEKTFKSMRTPEIAEAEAKADEFETLSKTISQLKILQQDMWLVSVKDNLTVAVTGEIKRLSELLQQDPKNENPSDKLSLPANFLTMSCSDLTAFLTKERMAKIRRAYGHHKISIAGEEDNPDADASKFKEAAVLQVTTVSALLAIGRKEGAKAYEEKKLVPRGLRLDMLPNDVQETLWQNQVTSDAGGD